jgi:PKD repeat protein
MKKLLFTLLTVFALSACGGGGGGGGSEPAPTPTNRAPTVSFTVACTDLECVFDATARDTDGTVTSYAWDFGDGNTSTTEDPSHTYSSYGEYNVRVTVTDDDNATGTSVKPLTVAIDIHAQTATIDMFDSSIIFKQDFDHRVDGEYTTNDLSDDFECLVGSLATMAGACSSPSINLEELAIENGQMKVTFKEGMVGTNLGFEKNLGQEHDELYLTFQVRFDDNYDQSTNGGKLMGLGGNADGRKDGFVPSGCDAVGPNEGFSTRFQYRQEGRLAHYVYHQNKTVDCGDQRYIEDFAEDDNYFSFRKEQTYTLEMRVKMNDVGQANGTMESYINGVKTRTDEFVFSEDGTIGINRFLFVLYIGGGPNQGFELLNPSTLYLDNFVLSTERVVQ